MSLFAKRQKRPRVGREPGATPSADDEEGMFCLSLACESRSDFHSQPARKR